MRAHPTRRHFLAIAAAGAAALPFAGRAGSWVWRGSALGAEASVTLAGVPEAVAAAAGRRVLAEIDRLERIFSLQRADGALSRLNRDADLPDPPAELVALLRLAGRLHAATGGAFDPTVQPLWRAWAEAGGRPPPGQLRAALARTGWQHVLVSERRIAFARPSMAITLNGIAQGLIADRVAALLRREGLRDILVDAGEIVAGGRASDGRAWSAAIATPDGQAIRRLSLADRALAVSSTLALAFDPAGTAGHILDPRTGAPAPPGTVAVSAVSAALADGLSTAFCLLGPAARAAALAIFPGARIEATA